MLFCIVIVFVRLYGLYVSVSPCTGNLPFVYPFKQFDNNIYMKVQQKVQQ